MQVVSGSERDPACRLASAKAQGTTVSKQKFKVPTSGSFGKRLAALRQNAGLSQRKLAAISGVSQRMIAHYETRSALPPGHVITAFADALGLSADELVGRETTAPKTRRSQTSVRILRRLHAMEDLPLKDKRELLAIIDTYLERHRLTKSA